MQRLNAVVSSLAMHAPVVMIGPAERQGELAALVAAGAGDYVARDANCLESAVVRIRKRLRQGRLMTRGAPSASGRQREDKRRIGKKGFWRGASPELDNPTRGNVCSA